MRKFLIFVLLLGLGVVCPVSYGARFSFTLDGQSNIFGAGRTGALPTPSTPVIDPWRPNSGQGHAPTAIPIDPAVPATPPPYLVLSFPNMTGDGVWYDVYPPASRPWSTPDGLVAYRNPTDISPMDTNLVSLNGISGFSRSDRIMFIVGVFLGPTLPTGAAPASLNFDNGESTVDFHPLIGQTFYVGNGRTATGVTQHFYVPTGATRLFLGFGDGMFFEGTPSYYSDNVGSFNVEGSFDPSAPEPASIGLVLFGAAAILLKIRRRRRA